MDLVQQLVQGTAVLTEAHNTKILPPDHTDTLYVSVIPSNESKCFITELLPDSVRAWVLGGGGKLYGTDDYHTTLVYSRKAGSELFKVVNKHNENGDIRNIVAYPKCFEIFGDCIVLVLESNQLRKMFKDYLDAGATFDFPDYNPHVTIAKLSGVVADTPELRDFVKNELSIAALDTFAEIRYTSISSEPLDEDWA